MTNPRRPSDAKSQRSHSYRTNVFFKCGAQLKFFEETKKTLIKSTPAIPADIINLTGEYLDDTRMFLMETLHLPKTTLKNLDNNYVQELYESEYTKSAILTKKCGDSAEDIKQFLLEQKSIVPVFSF